MSHTSKKRTFANTLMKSKPVTAIPGIGNSTGIRLKEAGCNTAFQLFGRYLLLDKDQVRFTEWMKDTCKKTVRSNNTSDCYSFLKKFSAPARNIEVVCNSENRNRLNAAGIKEPHHVYGIYLWLNKEKEQFTKWMENNSSVTSADASEIYDYINKCPEPIKTKSGCNILDGYPVVNEIRRNSILMTTTIKHQNFVNEPLTNRPVTDIPGIGKVAAQNLKKSNIVMARTILGHYMAMQGSESEFKEWLQKTGSVRPGDAAKCYNAINEWVNNFI